MKELSVSEAAEILGKTERTIRLYVTDKTLKARKVGKKWYLDRKSVEALRQSRGHLGSVEEVIPETKSAGSGNSGPNRLACFRLAREAFAMPLWTRADDSLIRDELLKIRTGAIKALGAGFYSYGQRKLDCYAEARAHIGSALGLFYSEADLLGDGQKEVVFLEEKLIPALNALIKSMERRKGVAGKRGTAAAL